MSSDESFSDESLDKFSPILSTDRILRSSSISSEPDRRMSIDFNEQIYSGNIATKQKRTSFETKGTSRSFQKIRLSVENASSHEIEERSSQIFDINHLKDRIQFAHICPDGRLELIIDTERNSGLFHKNGLKCSICDEITELTNFPMRPSNQLQVPNQRLYAASAISGIGYDVTHFVLSLLGMNIPYRANFYKQVHHIYNQLFDFAHADFLSLINDIRSSNQCESDIVLDLTISLDGTWKKRGHRSMYGIVFLIDADSGYCIDFETLSKRCEKCEAKQRTSTKTQFERWYQTHQSTCYKTWDGSSGAMEKEGAKKIFERSLAKDLPRGSISYNMNCYLGIRYTNMISDGDSSAYEAVKHTYTKLLLEGENVDGDFSSGLSPEQYSSIVVTKEDCINHMKKRVSNHLKTLKSRYSGFESAQGVSSSSTIEKKKSNTQQDISSHLQAHSSDDDNDDGNQRFVQPVSKSRRRRRLPDGKPYGGSASRMTKVMEKKLADFYGLAIRQSSELAKNLDEDDAVALMERMCRAAFLHHIKQSNREIQHRLCPTGSDSWCSYHADKYVSLKQKVDSMKDASRLDPIFLEILTPMIDTLTNPKLLRRCLRGATQNANESINSVVWSILSKTKYHGFQTVRGAAAVASIFFNRGRSGLVKFFDQVGIPVTAELLDAILRKDWKRIEKAETNVEEHEIIKKKKEQQRIQSQIEEDEAMDYRAGQF